MNKKFIKENGQKYASELDNEDVMKVVKYITNSKNSATYKRNTIQSFLLNWTVVSMVK